MYTVDIYNLLLDALRTDKRGLSCEPDEFNRQIRLVSQEIYDDYIKVFEADTTNSDTLAFLKIHDYAITLTPLASRSLSYGTMPSNYYRVIGKPWILDGTTVRSVDEVTEFEDRDREDDFLTKATLTHPTCRIGGVNATNVVQIKVRPQTITTIYINYLKSVPVPFLDYYLNDTNYVPTFLPDTDVLQSLPADNTYRGGAIGGAGVTVASQTVDMPWGEGDLSLLLAKLMQKLGATLPDQGIQQAGVFEEQKLNA